MRKWLFSVVVIFGVLTCKAQTDNPERNQPDTLHWFTSVGEVYNLSNSTGRPIFAFFTGSDWCGWCHKLQREVFEKPSFVEWAGKNVVLLELDFPRRKALAPELAQQNNELQQVFRVGSFPTIWMFCLTKDEAAKKINISALGSLGYPPSAEAGKEEVSFLANANRILASCKK
ncbi:MAG TPA: thioredoxin family protein [Cyclobacteriaceae bacterium]|nr:thioredoxin family protein [Cyclobacteriaceae bacterium]